MASGLVSGLGASGAFAGMGPVGFVAGIAAGLVDTLVISPALARNADQPMPDDTLSVPTGAQGIGRPIISAYGRRIRVPCHVIWQSRKVRDVTATSKQGPATIERKVRVDALVALNANKTERLVQLFGSGKLLLWTERNLVGVTTDGMEGTWTAAATSLSIEMDTSLEANFDATFKVGDLVSLSGFGTTAAANQTILDNFYWRVTAVTAHAATTNSTITLESIEGQTFGTAGTADAGSPATPARVARLDACSDLWAYMQTPGVPQQSVPACYTFGSDGRGSLLVSNMNDEPGLRDLRDRFKVGDQFVFRNTSTNFGDNVYRINAYASTSQYDLVDWSRVSGTTTVPLGPINVGTSASRAFIRLWQDQQANPEFFATGYSVDDNFATGAEDQGENPLLIEEYGSGEISAYRGLSYVALDDMDVTPFGGMLPYALEAILEVDAGATLRGTVGSILESRSLKATDYNVEGLIDKTIEGCYVRGKTAAAECLQPLIVAHRILTQESGGVLSLFSLANAEVIDLRNSGSSNYSDLGWMVGVGSPPPPKVEIEMPSEQNLPTSVNVTFQDSDRNYDRGDAEHALRHPTWRTGHSFKENLDLDSLAMRQRDAKVLAQNTLRLAWINAEAFEVFLPMSYLDLLENHILRFTDDDGELRVGRIVQRTITEDWLVNCRCVVEDKDTWLTDAGYDAPEERGQQDFTEWPGNSGDGELLNVEFVDDVPAIEPGDLDGGAAIRVAVAGPAGGNWGGAAVYESLDQTSWTFLGNVINQTAIGKLETTLPVGTEAESYGTTTVTYDDTNTFDVRLDFDPGDIVTITDAECESGLQWFAILSSGEAEIVGVGTVAYDDQTGVYTFSHLLRGLRGTIPTSTHAVGTSIVRLDRQPMFKVGGISDVGSTRYYKVVGVGGDLDAAPTTAITPSARNVKPLPIRSVTITQDPTSYDITITVDAHWSRQFEALGSQPPHPMDEDYEHIGVYIKDDRDVSLRKLELTAADTGSPVLRDRVLVYTAAMQTSDGLTPGNAGDEFNFEVFQIGRWGFGPARTWTFTVPIGG